MALSPEYKGIGFDMDGTFMRTHVDYLKLEKAVYEEFVAAGVPRPVIVLDNGVVEEVESGMNWLNINRDRKTVEGIRRRIGVRMTNVELEDAGDSAPFEGAVEVLNMLKDRGYKVGILTRGGKNYAHRILKANGVFDSFDAIVCRDSYPDEEAKPSPKAMENLGREMGLKPMEILYIGDHAYDWMTARDSGAGFYGVRTGGQGIRYWKDIDERIEVLDSVKDLKDIILG